MNVLNTGSKAWATCLLLAFLCSCGQSTQTAGNLRATASQTPAITTTIPPAQPAATGEIPDLAGPVLLFPRLDGEPPTIDGIISESEWDQANVETYADGSELMLMRSNGWLYLAIRASGRDLIVGNVYLLHGDQISIHHASAALGTALYQQGVVAWERTQSFTWRCRDTGSSEAAQADRAIFLEEEGWLAGNSRMGTPNELEYQIALTDELSALAVVFLQGEEPILHSYPIGLEDDSVQVFASGIPEQMQLTTQLWAKISLADQ